MARPLTPNQLHLLHYIAGGGELATWDIIGDQRVSGALAFHARDRVYESLEKRGYLADHDTITEAGLAALAALASAFAAVEVARVSSFEDCIVLGCSLEYGHIGEHDQKEVR